MIIQNYMVIPSHRRSTTFFFYKVTPFIQEWGIWRASISSDQPLRIIIPSWAWKAINWLSQKVIKFLGNWFYYPCRHEFNRKSARSHIAIICLLQSLIFLSFHFFFAKFGTTYTANSKLFINIFPARCKNICNVHIFRLLSNDILSKSAKSISTLFSGGILKNTT